MCCEEGLEGGGSDGEGRDEPPPESVDPRIAALALAHLPTVHALFIRSVRALLRLRAAATGAAWERCPEWKMLPRHPSPRRCAARSPQ